MAKKNVKSQSGIGRFPMTNDDLVLLDNKSDKEIPNELLELQQRAPIYISALQSKPKLISLRLQLKTLGLFHLKRILPLEGLGWK